MAYAASADSDTLYYHQGMKEPDSDKFKEAMEKEIKDQWDNGNFSPKRRSEVPLGVEIIPGVWQLNERNVCQRARCISGRQDGTMMEAGNCIKGTPTVQQQGGPPLDYF